MKEQFIPDGGAKRISYILIGILCCLIIFLLYAYIESYGQNLPVLDEWYYSVRIARLVADGHLNLDVLIQANDAHRNVISNLITAIFTKYFNWNLRLALWINFAIGIINWVIVLFMLHRQNRHQALIAALPLAVLMFSLLGRSTWLVSYYSFWLQTNLLVLIVLLLLSVCRPTWLTLISVMLVAIILTFTAAPGMVIWVAVILLLPFFGYLRKRYFVAIGLLAIIAIGLYFRGSGISTESDIAAQNSLIQIRDLHYYPLFLFQYLRNVLRTLNATLSSVLTLSGVILIIINTILLIRSKIPLQELAVWLGIVLYVLGMTALKFIGRIGDENVPYMPDWYVQPATLFWIAIFVINVKALFCFHSMENSGWMYRLLTGATLTFQILVIGSLLYINIHILIDLREEFYPLQIHRTEHSEIEQCALDYAFSHDYSCQDEYRWGANYQYLLDGLAYRRLTIFADIDHQQVLPDYNGEPVILELGSYDISLNFETFFLAGIPEENILLLNHDLPDDVSAVEYWQSTLQPIHEAVWYISNTEISELESHLNAFYQLEDEFTVKQFIAQYYRVNEP